MQELMASARNIIAIFPCALADLSTKFAQYLNKEAKCSRNRVPSPLLTPMAVIESVMDSLQRNDYPDVDAGIHAAYRFAMPYSSTEGENWTVVQRESQYRNIKYLSLISGMQKLNQIKHEFCGSPSDNLPSARRLVRSWGDGSRYK